MSNRLTAARPERRAWPQRLTELARALGQDDPGLSANPSVDDLTAALGAVVRCDRPDEVWLALAVMSAALPDDPTVLATMRSCALDGAGRLATAVASTAPHRTSPTTVRVMVGATLVDVHHTVETELATGIQRVARETARRWIDAHECTPVAWDEGFAAMRPLTTAEAQRLGVQQHVPPTDDLVVPWRGTVLVPELAAELERSAAYLALARRSGNRTSVIGFDCVPFTSAETTQEGFAGVFGRNLAAVRHFDRIVPISHSAAAEYGGWRKMLGAVGRPGPQIEPVMLPEVAPEPTEHGLAAARDRFVVAGLPLVLVVGSHEPRKNHQAVLFAAEQLWRAGRRFSLTFIGGNAWNSERFTEQMTTLQGLGRPFESASKIPDELLWAAYRLARMTVFPSLNEGFGLPLAESLAAGTPAITSAHGSMAEIARAGGAVLVDPRSDEELTAAMDRLLCDNAWHTELTERARSRPRRTWDDYALESWEAMNAAPPA